MNNILSMLMVFMGGILLGFFFFGGLLWTVRRGMSAKHPGLWFLASWLVRIGVVLVTLYLLFNGRWERLLVCVSGFLIARSIVIHYTRTLENPGGAIKEANDAS